MEQPQVTATEAGVGTEAQDLTAGQAGVGTEVEAEAQVAEQDAGQAKTFSQDDIDKIVASRIGRLEKKWEKQRQEDIAAGIEAYEARQREARESAEAAEAQAEAESVAAAATEQATQDAAQTSKLQTSLAATLKRAQDADEKRKSVEAALAAEREKTEKLNRDLLIRTVAQEKQITISPFWFSYIEGDDVESIGESMDNLLTLGKRDFGPKQIGASNTPPNPAPTTTKPPTGTAAVRAKQEELTEIIQGITSTNRQRQDALEELSKL